MFPLRRTPLQRTGGNGSGPNCSGTLSVDFNAWIASGNNPALTPCTTVFAQFWSRDPALAPSGTTNLTNAIEFTIGP